MRMLLLATAYATMLLPAADGGAAPPPLPDADPGAAPVPSAADTALAQRVSQVLRDVPTLSPAARGIDVTARHGCITLRGNIAATDHLALRKRVADVAGVRSVQDKLIIHPTDAPSAPDSAPGAVPRKGQIDPAAADPRQDEADAELQRRVQQALIDDRSVSVKSETAPKVIARNGVVWIESRIWRPQERARIIAMIAELPGVERVDEGDPPEAPARDETTARYDPERSDDRPQAEPPPSPHPP